MFAKNVMSSHIVALKLGTDVFVRDAVVLLESSGLHELPVIDQEGKPIGLVSARSILHLALPGYAADSLLNLMKSGPDVESIYQRLKVILDSPIDCVVDANIDVVNAESPTSAIAAMLVNLKGDSRNILVVDRTGVLIGVITAKDLVCRQL